MTKAKSVLQAIEKLIDSLDHEHCLLGCGVHSNMEDTSTGTCSYVKCRNQGTLQIKCIQCKGRFCNMTCYNSHL